jgi:phosphoglycolate phosphatase-like HAD superfamily hydrolase
MLAARRRGARSPLKSAPRRTDHEGVKVPNLIVLGLDGTVVRLGVDWADVRERLIAIAEAHALDVPEHRVVRLLEAARTAGAHEAAWEMERVVREAELRAVAAAPANVALREWMSSLPSETEVAVLSLNCRRAVELGIARAGIDDRIGTCVAREDVEHHKPHPEGLIRLMARYGTGPEGTLVVGDGRADRACARAAGVQSVDVHEIGVRWERAAGSASVGGM